MKTDKRKAARGFLLIEILIAMLILTLGIMALAKLEAQVIGGAGETKSRSAAMALARSKMDALRTAILNSQYATSMVSSPSASTSTVNGIVYTMQWTVTSNASVGDNTVQVSVTWPDQAGNTQQVNLNSRVAWNDPVSTAMLQQDRSKSLIAPTGEAKRGTGAYTPGQSVTVQDGSGQSDKVTRLLNASGQTILYLDPDSQGSAQSFTKIYGRVYFDQTSNQLPSSANIFVRLSSEGECVYDHATANLAVVPTGATGNAIKYKYFSYTCYVGPGWYGSVGLSVIGDNTSPTVCVGDPSFSDNGYTVSAHAVESTTRSYRGFHAVGVSPSITYLSSGMRGGGVYGDNGNAATTKDGSPVPSAFPSVYTTITAGSNTDFFHQDFLVSKITGNASCAGQMALVSNTFSPNAGKYYCISPDKETSAADQCPSTWPGFTSAASCAVNISGSQMGSGASVSCTTSGGDACSCQATPGTANYACSTTGGVSQTATVTAVLTTTSFGAWETQSCVPSSSCVAPSNTASTEYRCDQSGCVSGSQHTQSRTVSSATTTESNTTAAAVTVNLSSTSISGYTSPSAVCKNSQPDASTGGSAFSLPSNSTTVQNNTPSSGKKTTTTTTWSNKRYVNTGTSCGSGGKTTWYAAGDKVVNTKVDATTTTYGSWTDTAATCVASSATLPTATSTTQYQWITSGCSSGQQLQKRDATGSSTQTCVRTTGALGCNSLTGFNMDSTTSACTTQ